MKYYTEAEVELMAWASRNSIYCSKENFEVWLKAKLSSLGTKEAKVPYNELISKSWTK